MSKRSNRLKQPSFNINTQVETIANPYLDKLSLKKNNIGKKKTNNCDLGLSLMETEKSNFK